MAEEIRFKLIVDTANGAAVIAALEKQLEALKAKLAQVKSVASPAVPSNSFDAIKNLPVNSIDALKNKLSELKSSLGQVEIGSAAFKQLSGEIKQTQTQLVTANLAVKGLDVAPAAGSINELKANINDMTEQLKNVAIGSVEFENLTKSVETANSELKNINKELKGVSDKQGLKEVGKVATGLVASFALASHAVEIFGDKTKSNEAVQKSLAATEKVLTEIFAARAIIEGIVEAKSAARFLLMKAQTIETKALSTATALFNAILEANPIGLVVVAVAALITAFVTMKNGLGTLLGPLKFLGDGLRAVAETFGILPSAAEEATARIKLQLEELHKATQQAYSDQIAIAQAAHQDTIEIRAKQLEDEKKYLTDKITLTESLVKLGRKLTEDQEKEYKQQKIDLEKNSTETAVFQKENERAILDAQQKARRTGVDAEKEGLNKQRDIIQDEYKQKLEGLTEYNELVRKINENTNAQGILNERNLLNGLTLTQEKEYHLLTAAKQERENALSKVDEEAIAKRLKELEARNRIEIDKFQEGTQARLDTEKAAAQKEFEFQKLHATQLHLTKTEILAAEAEKEKGFKKEQSDLQEKFIQDEAKRDQTRISHAISTENAIGQAQLLRIQSDLDNVATTEERRIELLTQYAEIEKSLVADQLRADLEDQKSKYDEETNLRKQKHDEHLLTDAQFISEQKAADDDYAAQKLLKQQQTANKEVQIATDTGKKILSEKEATAKKEQALMETATNVFTGLKEIELANAGDNEKKKKEIAKRYAIFEMALGLANVYSSTAQAVAKSVAEFPLTFGQPWAGFAIVNGAIQAGVLIAQKAAILGLASGGFVDGPGTETSDSIPANLSRGESVINARSTRMFRPLLSAINEAGGGVAFDFSPGFADGGIASGSQVDMKADIVDAIHSAFQTAPSLKVNLVETDVTQAQTRVRVIESRATIG